MEAVLEIDLAYPYAVSLETLHEFATTWKCRVLKSDTHSRKALLAVPWNKFKQIWHTNPVKGNHSVPSGAESFMRAVMVKDIRG